MAAITGTYGLVKRSHLSLQVTLQSASDGVSNTDLVTTSGLAALSGISTTNSPLYNFLTTAHASAAAANLAFRALGGEISVRQLSGTATTVIAVTFAAAGVVPAIVFGGGADQVLEVVISVPHSVIQ